MRPFVVGLVHGLAGSAAIALMVLSVIHDTSNSIRLPALVRPRYDWRHDADYPRPVGAVRVHLAVNLPKFNWRLRVASGLISFAFGIILIYGTGFAGWRSVHRRAEAGSRIERADGRNSRGSHAKRISSSSAGALTGIQPGRIHCGRDALEGGCVIHTIGSPRTRSLLLAGVAIALAATVVAALLHEPAPTDGARSRDRVSAKPIAACFELPTRSVMQRRCGPLHREVTPSAVAMTFAGIAYRHRKPQCARTRSKN